jgi:hypothetical protein
MNNKLLHFPDFANTVPIKPITDCESARAYMKAYDAYQTSNPGFDLHEPFEFPTVGGAPPEQPDPR